VELPIFPLNVVLFPGATLPLHIFEERYKEMVRLCIEEGRPFGVALIRAGEEVGGPAEPFPVGTTAHIRGVQHLEEGRMNLVCQGGKRFRILKTLAQTPFIVGDVELVETKPEDDPDTAGLAETAAALFAEYIRLYLAMSNQWARTIALPGDPGELADHIASRLAADPGTKQRLLEELSAHKRLSAEIDLLSTAIQEMEPRVQGARAARWYGFGAMN
jgi:Lon protease-like protein